MRNYKLRLQTTTSSREYRIVLNYYNPYDFDGGDPVYWGSGKRVFRSKPQRCWKSQRKTQYKPKE
jgi:hypothetical protein